MNKKGFTITVILYAMVILIVAIFALLLGTLKNRYKVKSDIQDNAMYYINNPNGPRGTAIMPTCNDIRYNGENQTLASGGSDIRIENNTAKDAGDHDVTVIAEDFYAFSDGTHKKTLTCKIKAGELPHTTSDANVTYDGLSHGISVSSTLSNATIKYGTSNGTYNLNSSPTYIEVGQNTVYYQITAPNYETVTGSQKVIINKRNVTYESGSSSKTYDGVALTNNTVTLTSGSLISGHTISKNVTGTQTNVGSSNNNFAVTIKDASGTDKTGNYNISYVPGTLTVNAKDGSGFEITYGAVLHMDPGWRPPASVRDGNVWLREDTDYTVSYSNNDKVGDAIITINYIGNYCGTGSTTYPITDHIKFSDINLERYVYTYSGTAIEPIVTIVYDSKTLTKDIDYTVSYSNNNDMGKGTVTITGKGYYYGTVSIDFNILKDAKLLMVTLDKESYVYNGTAIEPIVTVKDGTTTLTENTDYTVSYSDNTSMGTGVVTITGKGSYANSTTKEFTILKDVSLLTMSLNASSFDYTGSAIEPIVTVKDGTKTLTKDTDYTVSYNNNTELGNGTVTITGKGNYSGSKEVIFDIVDTTPPICSFTGPLQSPIYTGSTTTFTLTCTDISGFSDSAITSSDITLSTSGIVTISTPTKTTIMNGYKYTITVTGVKVGKVTLTLKEGSVSDEAGNKNTVVTSPELRIRAEYNVMGTFPSAVTNQKANITEVYFINDTQDNIDARYNAASIKANITNTSHSVGTTSLQSMSDYGKVLSWLEPIPETSNYKLYIGSEGNTYLSTGRELFYKYINIITYDLQNVKTNYVTDMSNMFGNYYAYNKVKNLDVSQFDTSNVTNMQGMFSWCSSLISLDLSLWNTSNVTNMQGMFESCSSLTSLNVSSFATSNVTNIQGMFSLCSSLTSLNVSSFDTSNITNMSDMFNKCSGLTNLDVSNFNTSNVTDMSSMFYGCSSLTSLNVSSFDTSSVTDMGYMFSGCNNLTSLDVRNFNTSNVKIMMQMFGGCSNLTSLDLSSFDTSSVTNMASMFSGCKKLTSVNLNNWNTSSVTRMESMFFNCYKLTSLDLSNFSTNSLTNTKMMFYGCNTLKTIYANNEWNNSSITNSSDMFDNCSALVGGVGTRYSGSHKDKEYARIDADDNPGYFTAKIDDDSKPTCSFSGPAQTEIFIGTSTTYTLTCTDDNGFIDTTISSSDFTLSNSGIVSISAPTKTSITNGYKYTITVTGTNYGSTTLTLKEGSVKDYNNNTNDAVVSNTTLTIKKYEASMLDYSNSKTACADVQCALDELNDILS